MEKLDPKEVQRLIKYDPATGRLEWRERTPDDFEGASEIIRAGLASRFNKIHAGKPALSSSSGRRYLGGTIKGRSMMAHTAAWVCYRGCYPSSEIDHIDRDKENNRIENLRDVSNSDNKRNRGMMRSNTSGVTGVRFVKKDNSWVSRIGENGEHKYLGSFKSFEEAVRARKEAEILMGYPSK